MEKQLFALAISENYKKYFKNLNRKKKKNNNKIKEINTKHNISNLKYKNSKIENQNDNKLSSNFKNLNLKHSKICVNSFQLPNNSLNRINNITFADLSQRTSLTDSDFKDNSFQELEMILSLLESSEINSITEENHSNDIKLNKKNNKEINFDCLGCFIF